MTKITEKAPNYTAAQEAMIREAAAQGPLNLARATELAAAMGKTSRSVIAKAVRMDIPYAKQVPVTKNGDPVASKEALVKRIGCYVAGDLSGLEKASKSALQSVLAAFVVAHED